MLLSNVEKNSVIFIDANIFLYDISLHPVHGDTCKAFLKELKTENFLERQTLLF